MGINNSKNEESFTKTTSFRVALYLPLALSLVTFLVSLYSEKSFAALNNFLDEYKSSIAIASLSLPLVAWSIAHHRSTQTIKSLQLQRDKRLYDLYYERQKHFETTIGRKIELEGFSYLKQQDLPLLFSALYEYDALESKQKVSMKVDAANILNAYLSQTKEIIEDFTVDFSKVQESEPEQYRKLDLLQYRLYEDLCQQSLTLAKSLHFPRIRLEDARLSTFKNAYVEVVTLSFFIGKPLEDVWGDDDNGYEGSKLENVIDTFDGAIGMIKTHMHIQGEPSFGNLRIDSTSRKVIAQVNMTPLQIYLNKIFEHLTSKIVKELMLSEESIEIKEGEFFTVLFHAKEKENSYRMLFEKSEGDRGLLIFRGKNFCLQVEIAEESMIDDEALEHKPELVKSLVDFENRVLKELQHNKDLFAVNVCC